VAAPILSRAIRNAAAMMRAAEWGSSSVIPPNSQAGSPSTGAPLSTDARALGVSTILSCVKALSDDTSTVPFYAFEGDPLGAHQPLAKQPRIVTEPFGPELDPRSGMGQLVVSTAMRGNGYAFVVNRDKMTDLPDQLTIIHPDAVRPTREKGVKVFKIGHETYGTREVVHVTGMMLPGGVMGVDIVSAQRVNVELSNRVGDYADAFFGSGGSPSGVISVPGQGSRGKAREVKQEWQATHGGAPNAHQPAILFGGATWTQLSVSPENAQFLETRRFLREEICGWFSVPLQRIQAIVENASQGGGAGLDAIDAQYIKHGILPILASIETPWDRMLPTDRTWLGFNLDVFLRASAKVRAEIGQIHRVTAVRTIDEIRAAEGWAPLPDGIGEDPFTPLNSNTSPTGGADNQPAPGNEGSSS
jgi:HK97 family phage portal protein